MVNYILPIKPFRYPVPKPGHVKGTKKEWIPCPICTKLVLRKLNHKQIRTCSEKCSDAHLDMRRIQNRNEARRKTKSANFPFKSLTKDKSMKQIRKRENDRYWKRKIRYQKFIQKLWRNQK